MEIKVNAKKELQQVIKTVAATFVLQFKAYSNELRYVCLETGEQFHNQAEGDGFEFNLESNSNVAEPLKYEDVKGEIPHYEWLHG